MDRRQRAHWTRSVNWTADARLELIRAKIDEAAALANVPESGGAGGGGAAAGAGGHPRTSISANARWSAIKARLDAAGHSCWDAPKIRKQWSNLLQFFRKIHTYEKSASKDRSYFTMDSKQRKSAGLDFTFDRTVYDMMLAYLCSKEAAAGKAAAGSGDSVRPRPLAAGGTAAEAAAVGAAAGAIVAIGGANGGTEGEVAAAAAAAAAAAGEEVGGGGEGEGAAEAAPGVVGLLEAGQQRLLLEHQEEEPVQQQQPQFVPAGSASATAAKDVSADGTEDAAGGGGGPCTPGCAGLAAAGGAAGVSGGGAVYPGLSDEGGKLVIGAEQEAGRAEPDGHDAAGPCPEEEEGETAVEGSRNKRRRESAEGLSVSAAAMGELTAAILEGQERMIKAMRDSQSAHWNETRTSVGELISAVYRSQEKFVESSREAQAMHASVLERQLALIEKQTEVIQNVGSSLCETVCETLERTTTTLATAITTFASAMSSSSRFAMTSSRDTS